MRSLAARITSHPILADLKGKEHVPETVHHVLVPVDPAADSPWAAADAAQPKSTTDGVHAADKVGIGVTSPESSSEAIKLLKPRLLLQVVERLQMTQVRRHLLSSSPTPRARTADRPPQ